MASGSSEEVVILVAMAILLSIAPGRRALVRELGDAYIGVWTVVAIVGLIAVEDIRGGSPFLISFILIIVFAAATLVRPGYLIVIAAAALAGYAVAPDRAGADFGNQGQRFEITIFAISALFAIAAAFSVNRVFITASRRLSELTARVITSNVSESS